MNFSVEVAGKWPQPLRISLRLQYAHRAFATVETIGSRYAIQTGHLLELSAQQLISCDTGRELDGCNGGALEFAFYSVKYVRLLSSQYISLILCICL